MCFGLVLRDEIADIFLNKVRFARGNIASVAKLKVIALAVGEIVIAPSPSDGAAEKVSSVKFVNI